MPAKNITQFAENVPIELVDGIFGYSNNIKVEVGTNCPQKGENGITIFRIDGDEKTCASVATWEHDRPERKTTEGLCIEITLYGDDECGNFVEILKFAVNVLQERINEGLSKK